jgi:hypothetical protein
MHLAARLAAPVVFVTLTASAVAHGPAYPETDEARAIEFPDTENYKTLVLDLHTHSVFSDGHVWPTVRVSEALRDGLDGLAITEHLEFQPHLSDIPHPDRNRAFLEARRAAEGQPLTVIPGVEITRLGDPGHINAIFVEDANLLVKQPVSADEVPRPRFSTREEAEAFSIQNSELFRGAHEVSENGETFWRPFADDALYQSIMNFGFASRLDPYVAVKAANEQGGFLFWNHPSFEHTHSELNAFHQQMVQDALLHGIEVANGDRYYPNAHRLALKHDLALIGVSDVHELIEWDYRPGAAHNPGHRPVTLVLAEGESIEAMKDALFARRSIVWWKDRLIGREAHVTALLAAILTIDSVEETNWGRVIHFRNRSVAPLELRQLSDTHFTSQTSTLKIPPNGVTAVTFNANADEEAIDLSFEVLNALIAPGETARIRLQYP